MSKYFKGEFLKQRIILTVILLSIITLSEYGLISNTLNSFFAGVALIVFFIVDSDLRKNEPHY
ncbi:hypothetical protein AOX59_03070 [Lentibacillus amyloliquefaciens]|uniref:Uncharacterized protein n=1 Tax=Lentibacillus amyloliquefaciens TaxID=1472767 RepID=A0A0U4EAV9_9BACI|nr:hypothetical protein AOX59_03070 [Lentibacillus amyloliquefaciens]